MFVTNELREYIYDIVGILYEVHRELGAGLNESVYQEGLQMELELQKIPYSKELSFHPIYKGMEMESSFRLDFLVNEDVIVELKAVAELTNDHRAQLFNYMQLCQPVGGILVNFAPQSCQVERYLFDSKTGTILSMEGKPISRKKSAIR